MAFSVLLVGLCIAKLTQSHMLLKYPPPRTQEAFNGVKTGPCGDHTNNFSGPVTELIPGETVTIIIEEIIHHVGAPYRLALSQENQDTGFSKCILLDHIPQHTYNRIANELHINITVPNVYCNLCSIQALSIMTDKIEKDSCCEYNNDGISGSCFSNYHSCSNIFINGTINRNNLLCKGFDDTISQLWSFKNWKTNRYTQEESNTIWNEIIYNENTLILELNYTNTNTNNNNYKFDNDPCDKKNNIDINNKINKYILLIGIDAFGAMYMKNSTQILPNINSLIQNGIYTFNARNVYPTNSASNWGAVLTGLSPVDSGFIDSNWTPIYTNNDEDFIPPMTGIGINPPTIFDILKDEYDNKIVTAASVNWIWHNYLLQNLDYNSNNSNIDFFYQRNSDNAVMESVIYFINEWKPNFMYVHLDDLDAIGHETYWGSDQYYDVAQNIDGKIGEIINVLKDINMFDETLIIVTADHGGISDTHSLTYPSKYVQYIPVIFSGNLNDLKVDNNLNNSHFRIDDLTPIILDYFNVNKNKYKYMRG
eukprot:143057_1